MPAPVTKPIPPPPLSVGATSTRPKLTLPLRPPSPTHRPTAESPDRIPLSISISPFGESSVPNNYGGQLVAVPVLLPPPYGIQYVLGPPVMVNNAATVSCTTCGSSQFTYNWDPSLGMGTNNNNYNDNLNVANGPLIKLDPEENIPLSPDDVPLTHRAEQLAVLAEKKSEPIPQPK
jgi:hypothetical protein